MDQTIKQLVNRFKTNDPFRIAEGLNIHVRFETLEVGTRGLYLRVLRRRFIVINNDLDENWRRVICAHELGHDRLHPGFNRFWIDEQTFFNAGKYERQANRFAIKLLTATDKIEYGCSVKDFLMRNEIPLELHKYY